MLELELLSCAESASHITARGPKISTRGVQGWIEKHPDLAIKVGGKCRLHVNDIELILSGIPIAEVAARRRALKAAAVAATTTQHESPTADSRAERRHARRRVDIGGARRRRR
jgi:hypothetical protein